jgi:hypothetical protein
LGFALVLAAVRFDAFAGSVLAGGFGGSLPLTGREGTAGRAI